MKSFQYIRRNEYVHLVNRIQLITAVFHWIVYIEIEVSGINLKQNKKQKVFVERINRRRCDVLFSE